MLETGESASNMVGFYTQTLNTFRFYCWGPSKSPLQMTTNEIEDWHAHLQTPILFNPHKPIDINDSTIEHVNLNQVKSTTDAIKNRERVLILTPLRDASLYLPQYFDLLSQLAYPHELIDVAFLVGDSRDDTMAALVKELERVQSNEEVAFRSTMVVEKDFGVTLSQNDVQDRHKFELQGPRRKAMGRARNYLLATALKPEHSWVYWRDVDIKDSPANIIEDLVAHDRDIIVPSMYATSGLDELVVDKQQMYGSIDTKNAGARISTLKADVSILGPSSSSYD